MYNVQSLEILAKIGEVNGYVRATIDKLEGIRGDLVRIDDDWQEWKFPQLVEALRKWTERNPVKQQPRSMSQNTRSILSSETGILTPDKKIVKLKILEHAYTVTEPIIDPLIVKNVSEQSIEKGFFVPNIYVLIALDLITGQPNVNHARHVKNVIGATIPASAIIVLTKVTTRVFC